MLKILEGREGLEVAKVWLKAGYRRAARIFAISRVHIFLVIIASKAQRGGIHYAMMAFIRINRGKVAQSSHYRFAYL